jgi:hypothetical protein
LVWLVALVNPDAPVVGVVVVEAPLAVVGANEGDVVSDTDDELVATLDHEVAGGAVDVDPFARGAVSGAADLALRAQEREGTVGQPERCPRNDRRHVIPLF